MSEQPAAPPPAEPPSERPPSHRGELVVVALAFAAGIGLAANAATGSSDEGTSDTRGASTVEEVPSPPAQQTTEVTPPPPVVDDGTVVFTNARSNIEMTPGCNAEIGFHWEVDAASDPPYGGLVHVDVKGPVIAGLYPYPLTRQGIDAEFFPTVTPGDHRWTAEITGLIEDPLRAVEAAPLEVSFSGQC